MFSVAAICWSLHYIKRILETLFIHRFSHGTMPLRNLFKNCSYYWLFTLYVAYHINHPLYTAPCSLCFYVGLGGFIVSASACNVFNSSTNAKQTHLYFPCSNNL